LFFFMCILPILDIRRIADTYDRKSHTENTSALLERFRNQYDLIITDIVMPNMDGIEVITEIKMKHPNVKIIAMTGGSAKLDRDFLAGISKAMRVDKVITKPFNVRDVQKVVDELLNV